MHQAYDAHMNLILSDVEETITLVDVGDDGSVSGVRVSESFSGVLLPSHNDNCLVTKECRKKHGDAFRSRRRRDHGKAAHVSFTWKVRSYAPLHLRRSPQPDKQKASYDSYVSVQQKSISTCNEPAMLSITIYTETSQHDLLNRGSFRVLAAFVSRVALWPVGPQRRQNLSRVKLSEFGAAIQSSGPFTTRLSREVESHGGAVAI